jgi:hypothetical protein
MSGVTTCDMNSSSASPRLGLGSRVLIHGWLTANGEEADERNQFFLHQSLSRFITGFQASDSSSFRLCDPKLMMSAWKLWAINNSFIELLARHRIETRPKTDGWRRRESRNPSVRRLWSQVSNHVSNVGPTVNSPSHGIFSQPMGRLPLCPLISQRQ